MTRLGWFGCLVLLAFWIGGLSAFLLGGLVWLGHVVQAFLVVVLWWAGRECYREYAEELKDQLYREQIFREWARRQNSHLKGME